MTYWQGRLYVLDPAANQVWRYDPSANTLTIIYDDGVTVNGVLTGVDNVETSKSGTVYVACQGRGLFAIPAVSCSSRGGTPAIRR